MKSAVVLYLMCTMIALSLTRFDCWEPSCLSGPPPPPPPTPSPGPYGVFVESSSNWNVIDTLFFARTLRCAAEGAGGTQFIIGGQDTARRAAIWYSSNSGFDWVRVLQTGSIGSRIEDITNIVYLNQLCAVSSDGEIFRSVNNGRTWTLQFTAPRNLNAVDFFDTPLYPNELYGFAVGGNGIVYGSGDGGITWFGSTSGVSDELFDVYCSKGNTQLFRDTVIAVGANGRIIHSEGGGFSGTWVTSIVGDGRTFKTVFFSEAESGRYGLATGNSGLLYRTEDGGRTWQNFSIFSSGNIEDVIANSDGHCIQLNSDGGGVTIRENSNYGMGSWSSTASINHIYLYSLMFRGHMINNNYGFAVGVTN
jgi:photosystem II stability/assembly factor-like uncharacterized protein